MRFLTIGTVSPVSCDNNFTARRETVETVLSTANTTFSPGQSPGVNEKLIRQAVLRQTLRGAAGMEITYDRSDASDSFSRAGSLGFGGIPAPSSSSRRRCAAPRGSREYL